MLRRHKIGILIHSLFQLVLFSIWWYVESPVSNWPLPPKQLLHHGVSFPPRTSPSQRALSPRLVASPPCSSNLLQAPTDCWGLEPSWVQEHPYRPRSLHLQLLKQCDLLLYVELPWICSGETAVAEVGRGEGFQAVTHSPAQAPQPLAITGWQLGGVGDKSADQWRRLPSHCLLDQPESAEDWRVVNDIAAKSGRWSTSGFECTGAGKDVQLARFSRLVDFAKAGVSHFAGRRLEVSWRRPASKGKGRPASPLLPPHRVARHVNFCRVWHSACPPALHFLQLLLLLLCSMVAPLPHQRHGGRPGEREEPAGDQVERAEAWGGEPLTSKL